MSVGAFQTGPKGMLTGHGQSIPRRRFAWPDPRKQHSGGNASPWFLREWGSRPSRKRKPALAEVA